MKKYKYLPTNAEYFEQSTDRGSYRWYQCGKINVPAEIVENGNTRDWEEIKEHIIPPGIVVFKVPNGYTIRYKEDVRYEDWARFHLSSPPSAIHTISIDGIEWSVEDWCNYGIPNSDIQVRSFEWVGDKWRVWIESGGYFYLCNNSRIFKGKYRKPICQLPDEDGKMLDMFEGDITWYVKLDWDISSWKMDNSRNQKNFNRAFPTKLAAEKYVRDNKPEIPLGGAIEEFINNWNYNNYECISAAGDLYMYLKSFKDKLGKK